MAFLDEIGHGQAVMPEAGGERDDEAHMGRGQTVERGFVPFILPADGEGAFLLAFEERGIHRGTNESATYP